MGYLSKLTFWYFSKKSLPYWCIFLIDCLIVVTSSLFVYTINYGLAQTVEQFSRLCLTLGLYLIPYIIGFKIWHTYSGIIRYSSFIDLQKVSLGVLTGMLFALVFRSGFHLNEYLVPIRFRDVILWSALAIALMWGLRVMVKFLYDSLYTNRGAQKVFIYGVRQGGIAIAKSIRNQDPAKYVVGGFVTDEPEMTDRHLMGVRVYPNDKALTSTMVKMGIKALFVSPFRSQSLRQNQAMVNALIDSGIKIFMVPSEQEWDGKSTVSHHTLREVDIEDLLPRDKIEVDMEAIGQQLTDKRILITGAAGSIGSEIVRQVALYHPQALILIDQAETPLHDIRLMMARLFPEIEAHTIVADIAHQRCMETIFATYRPQYVFHAAAYKHVPMMEDNPSESIRNNVEGTRVVADLAVKYHTSKFVMVSTDKAVNPTNVMGCSKRICEIYVQSLDKAIKEGAISGRTQFVTTRFGNVLGSNGSVIPLFKQQIMDGGPLTVTHPDIIRYFMLIPEACKLVLEAATMGHGGEIFVFDMGEPVKIVDLAQRMIRLYGADIEIKFTGLRDGEKLYEEVLNEKETTLPTVHPKIMVARVREYDYETVNGEIDHLLATAINQDNMAIVRRMKMLVPEFISQNSVYEAIDRELAAEPQPPMAAPADGAPAKIKL